LQRRKQQKIGNEVTDGRCLHETSKENHQAISARSLDLLSGVELRRRVMVVFDASRRSLGVAGLLEKKTYSQSQELIVAYNFFFSRTDQKVAPFRSRAASAHHRQMIGK
jgi:hypothetical protein